MAFFDLTVRAVACINCGAPLNIAPTGGTAVCDHCGSTLIVEPRRVDRSAADVAWLADDAYGMDAFFTATGLQGKPWSESMPLLQQIWMEARRQPHSDDGYRLFAATLLLSSGHAARGEPSRRRAVLDTALEALPDPGHRAIVRCHLARAAVREGDGAAAERWLAGIAPGPYPSTVSAELDVTWASLSSDAGEYARVLRLLSDGNHRNSTTESLADQLRTDALERLGRPSDAAAALEAGIARHGPAVFVGWLQSNDLAPQTRQRWLESRRKRVRRVRIGLAVVVVALAAGIWFQFGR